MLLNAQHKQAGRGDGAERPICTTSGKPGQSMVALLISLKMLHDVPGSPRLEGETGEA